jgi:hypothetical protein
VVYFFSVYVEYEGVDASGGGAVVDMLGVFVRVPRVVRIALVMFMLFGVWTAVLCFI